MADDGQSWYIVANGREQGPISEGSLRRYVREGRIGPERLVRKADMPEAIKAGRIRGLLDGAPAWVFVGDGRKPGRGRKGTEPSAEAPSEPDAMAMAGGSPGGALRMVVLVLVVLALAAVVFAVPLWFFAGR